MAAAAAYVYRKDALMWLQRQVPIDLARRIAAFLPRRGRNAAAAAAARAQEAVDWEFQPRSARRGGGSSRQDHRLRAKRAYAVRNKYHH